MSTSIFGNEINLIFKKDAEIDKKRDAVFEHYQRAYKVKFKSLSDAQVEDLYRKLMKLRDAEYFSKHKE